MNKLVTAENLILGFPYSLTENETQIAIALVTAAELAEMYEDNDILALYARIDKLDEILLDILAYDFKIDWWNKNYTLEEKREILKNCWKVHRKKGTPEAVNLPISSIYKKVAIEEWYKYGGDPYRFKLQINTGEIFVDYDNLQNIIERVRYYKNLRSVLENIAIYTQKSLPKMYIGLALHEGIKTELRPVNFDPDDYAWLVDEDGVYLTDENGYALYV